MGSKTSSFSLSGIKTKPATFLAKSIDNSFFKQLAEIITGQEFDKNMNEGAVKRF